jgi:hypothetical protein
MIANSRSTFHESSSNLGLFLFTLTLTIVCLKYYIVDNVIHYLNADFLLPGLMSISEPLTWFYWGQARFGNLIPILVSPIKDFDLNLSIQLFLNLTIFSLLILMTNKLFFEKINVNQIIFSVLIVTFSIYYIRAFGVLTWGFYGVSSSSLLIIISLIAVRKNSWYWTIAASFFLTCAFWLHSSTPIVLFPLVIYCIFLTRESNIFNGKISIGYLFIYFVNSIAWYTYTKNNTESVQIKFPNLIDFQKVILDFKTINLINFVVLLIIIIYIIKSPKAMNFRLIFLALFTYAFQFLNLLLSHVHLNGLDSRFFVLSNFLTFYLLSLFLLGIFPILVNLNEHIYKLSIILMTFFLSNVFYNYVILGNPKNGGIEIEVSEVLRNIQSTKYDFISGDYWIGWPVVIELEKQNIELMAILPRSEDRQTRFTKLSARKPQLTGLCIGEVILCEQQISRYSSNIIDENVNYTVALESLGQGQYPISTIIMSVE